MDWITAKDVIDWYLGEASEDSQNLLLTFFGGEPLIEFHLIQRMVEYTEELAAKLRKKVEFSATTNGSLFTDKVARFWKDHHITLLLSVDGAPKTQNSGRPTLGGKTSSRLIEKTLPIIRETVPNCTVRLTVTPENSDYLVENLQYLYDYGFRSLAHYPVDQGWDKPALVRLDMAYRAAANWYLNGLSCGKHVHMGLFSLIARRLIEWNEMNQEQRRAPQVPCGAGKGYLGIGVDGTIYPCHRFVSLDNFAGRFTLGHVRTGINNRLRNQFVRITNHSMLGCHTVCSHCEARCICSGGCLVQNLTATGDMFMPMPAQQFISTMYFEIARDILNTLEAKRKDLLPLFLSGFSKNKHDPDEHILTDC
jgi:uncharacterized protein